jgi:hypothetical protein
MMTFQIKMLNLRYYDGELYDKAFLNTYWLVHALYNTGVPCHTGRGLLAQLTKLYSERNIHSEYKAVIAFALEAIGYIHETD